MSFATDKCFQAKTGEVERQWFTVDASEKVLGRLAVKLATVLMGKHKPTYTPHIDVGDFVVVTNAEKVALTGRKREQIQYDHYTYYPGGHKYVSFVEMQRRHPDRVIREAVRRMLPKNALSRRMLLKLKIYAGTEHPHTAQQPQPLNLDLV